MKLNNNDLEENKGHELIEQGKCQERIQILNKKPRGFDELP